MAVGSNSFSRNRNTPELITHRQSSPPKHEQANGKHGHRQGQTSAGAPAEPPRRRPAPPAPAPAASTPKALRKPTSGINTNPATSVPTTAPSVFQVSSAPTLSPSASGPGRFRTDHQRQHRADARGGHTEHHQRHAHDQHFVINITHRRASQAGLQRCGKRPPSVRG